MTDTPTCSTCPYLDPCDYGSLPEDDAQRARQVRAGLCRRHAPRPGNADDMDAGKYQWPMVAATDWCGEHPLRT